jgi:uncharacterized protein (DUF952 family)
MARTLLHLVAREAWPPSFPITPGPEGFIHLCTPAQAEAVLGRFFGGGPAWALVIAPAVEAAVRDEDTYGHGAYPHLYGTIEAQQVLARVEVTSSTAKTAVARALAEADAGR